MIDLAPFAELVTLEHGLSVVVTLRLDHSPATVVVNAGVVAHPLTGSNTVAFVSVGGTRKLAHLRANPTIAVVVRAGWQWSTVEGTAELIGPDDPNPGVDDEALRLLLREIYSAAGGTHDDWATYDQTMREERRTAVLVTPTRLYSNL